MPVSVTDPAWNNQTQLQFRIMTAMPPATHEWVGIDDITVTGNVTPFWPGDYNVDGVVDAADYVVWRKNVGAATLNNRDPNGMGAVGQADYDFWRMHFGEAIGSGSGCPRCHAPVPEPTSLGLAALSVFGLVARAQATAMIRRPDLAVRGRSRPGFDILPPRGHNVHKGRNSLYGHDVLPLADETVMNLGIAEIRNNLADALNRVVYSGDRVVLERRGKPTAAIISLDDLALLEALEDREDVRAAKRALADMRRKGEKPIPWEQVKKQLKL